MKIIVCIKQVPSTNEVKLDPETKTIIRDGRQSVINPFDTYAMEEAVRLKEKLGGTVCALSMGIPAVERLLREAMSRGVDSALPLSDRAFAGADTLATAYTLSLGVRHLGDFDLILCGRMAIDGDTAQIGPELAEDLGIPQVTNVTAILEAREGELLCAKATDQGTQQVRGQAACAAHRGQRHQHAPHGFHPRGQTELASAAGGALCRRCAGRPPAHRAQGLPHPGGAHLHAGKNGGMRLAGRGHGPAGGPAGQSAA